MFMLQLSCYRKAGRRAKPYETVVVSIPCNKWVPVTMEWHVLRLQMEEQPPMMVAVYKLNKQAWTVNMGWSSSLRVGRGANNSSVKNRLVKKHSYV
jgi:hypothetical protein